MNDKTRMNVKVPILSLGSEYHNYFDHCGNPKYYGDIKSPDMKHWQVVSATISFPKDFRHGPVLRVPEPLVENLSSSNSNHLTKD